MPASSIFSDIERSTAASFGDDGRALAIAIELMSFENPGPEPDSLGDLSSFVNPLSTVGMDEVRSKKSQNMTECVPVPSSEHVAEIVGRQGCKIKALRAKTNTYIKTPVRGEEPVFVVTGRKEDVAKAKREILSAAEHFSQIRASRKNNLAGLNSGASTPPGPPANVPGHVTLNVRVPYRVVGLVVGPKGATIKRIQHQTHTYIVTPSRDKDPTFEVTGLPENVESARQEIMAHIAMRTGNGTSVNGLTNLDSTSFENDVFAPIYKNSLNALLGDLATTETPFPVIPSSAGSSNSFSISNSNSSGSCSSSSSTTGGRTDLGGIWSSNERDEGYTESPFDNTTGFSSIWAYPPSSLPVPTRTSPSNRGSPTDSLISSKMCVVCDDNKVTHALVPCGHNYFCVDCANRVCGGGKDATCPLCAAQVLQAIRIYSANP